MFRAYLFDLDGTLVDSEPWHLKSEVEIFGQFGWPLTEEQLHPIMGTTLPGMLDYLAKTYGVRVGVDEFLEVSQVVLGRHIRDDMNLFLETAPFLEELGDVRKAIVTSSLPWYVSEVFAKFPSLPESMEFTICGADVERGKPDPEPYLIAIDRMGLRADECCVFEDSRNGVASAKAAGCYVVGVNRVPGQVDDAHEIVPMLRHPSPTI